MQNWPTFDSMEQCEGATGIPKDRLQAWKVEGAPGFRGSRVVFGELLPWMSAKLFTTESDGEKEPAILSWKDKLDRQEFLKNAGTLLEYDKAMSILRSALMPLRQFLLAMSSTLAPRCNPSDPDLARRAIDLHVKQGMRMIADAEREKLAK